MIRLADGSPLAVWTEKSFETYAARLGEDGAPIAPPQRLDDGGVRVAADRQAIGLPGGGFLIAGSVPSQVESNPAGLEPGVYLLVFGPDGARHRSVRLTAFGVSSLPSVWDMAVDATGRPVVAWVREGTVHLQFFDADLRAESSPWTVAELADEEHRFFHLALARQPTGETLLAWERVQWRFGTGELFDDPEVDVHAQAWYADGTPHTPFLQPLGVIQPLGEPRVLYAEDPAAGFSLDLDLAVLGPERYLATWTQAPVGGHPGGVRARELKFDGSPAGPAFAVNAEPVRLAAEPRIVPISGPILGEDGFAVLWTAYPEDSPLADEVEWASYHEVRGRFFHRPGQPLGGELRVPSRQFGHGTHRPSAVFTDDRLHLLWSYSSPSRGTIHCCGLPNPQGDRQEVRSAVVPLCLATSTRLCLQGARFAVEVEGPTRRAPGRGLASAKPVTEDTGTFWFFRPDNVELMVKVLDGRSVNDHFWVFSGALSDLDYTIRVHDLWTDRTASYGSGGRLMSLADTTSIEERDSAPFVYANEPLPVTAGGLEPLEPGAPFTPAEPVGGPQPGLTSDPAVTPSPVGAVAAAGGGCDDPRVACFHGGRFEARVAWTDPRSGATGDGFVQNLTDESGYFWFFRESNAELVMKVLDGTPVNGHWWVFIGGLTDVELTLTVEDTLLGNTFTHVNPPYVIESTAHTAALPGE